MIHFLHKDLINAVHAITINLIGCGGTGSHLITKLARIDYSLRELEMPRLHVNVYDPDVVSKANIGRQMFMPSDIGYNKAQIAVTRLNRAYGLEWQACPMLFDSRLAEQRNHHANITISAVDTVEARYGIDTIFNTDKPKRTHITNQSFYWLDLGNTKNTGQIILGSHQIEQPQSKYETVKKLKTVIEKYPQLKDYETLERQGGSCSVAESLQQQDLFINSIMAEHAGNFLWKLFKNGNTNSAGLFVNLQNQKSQPIELVA